jgi:benzoyl-CoA reductase/2-hydroxyglutaryl-CoA dehydratase subunit BcrC/BadD/HgdB
MDKEEHNKLVADVLKKLPERKKKYTGPRLMLIGSELGDTRLVRLIESVGATVVMDRLCGGSSYIWNNVIPNEDRLLALAYAYLGKPRCPVKDEAYRHRDSDIMLLAIDYGVEGVIYNIQRFCTPHQQDRPPLFEEFKKKLYSVHEIEHDGTVPAAEYMTRIEAFVETLNK